MSRSPLTCRWHERGEPVGRSTSPSRVAPLIDELFGADGRRRPATRVARRRGVPDHRPRQPRRRDHLRVHHVESPLHVRGPSWPRPGWLLEPASPWTWPSDSTRERTTAATLVAAMLPERLPVVDGWSIVARYLPSGDAVCGDWYDVSPLPDGQLLIGVGDAAGHGLPAATLMAELRNAARGIAFAGHKPTQPARRPLRAGRSERVSTASPLPPTDGSTRPRGSGSWAVAGHLPLAARARRRSTPRTSTGRSHRRSASAVPATDHRIDLRPGDTLAALHGRAGRTTARVTRSGPGAPPIGRCGAGAGRRGARRPGRGRACARTSADDCCLLILRRNDANRTGRPRSAGINVRVRMSDLDEPRVPLSAFRHEALFYAGDDEFLGATVPFIADGLERDEPVLVVVNARKIDALRRRLDGAADEVQFADMAEIGRNPGRIIPAWREFVTANGAGGRRLRGIGEPISADRSRQRSSSATATSRCSTSPSRTAGDWWLLCPYDTASLPAEVVDEARRTHPFLFEGGTAPVQSVGARSDATSARRSRIRSPTRRRTRPRSSSTLGGLAAVRALVRDSRRRGRTRRDPQSPISSSPRTKSRPTASATAVAVASCGSWIDGHTVDLRHP